MNIRLALGALAFIALTAMAHATPRWNGVGWYVVGEDMGGGWVEKGPFASKEACVAALPADTEDEIYGCEYLVTRPDWDE